jgi:hypothetical protein
MSPDSDYSERRQHQRFPAIRDGKPCIDIEINGTRQELIDLSVDGFSIPACSLEPDSSFDFIMRLIDGFGDKVRGRAQVVNELGGPENKQIGCCFVSLDERSEKILHEWLTVIVICGASVRLTPEDAEAIVKGPSLI